MATKVNFRQTPKKLSDTERKEIISLTREDLTRSKIIELVCVHYDQKTKSMNRKYLPNDTFVLPKNTTKLNKKDIETTIGSYIVNRVLYERFNNVLDYQNQVIDKGAVQEIESKLSNALLHHKITEKEFKLYLRDIQWLGYEFVQFLVPSFTPKVITPLSKVKKTRKELVSKNKVKLEQGDAILSAEIKSEILDVAKKEIGNDPGMDMFNSGAKGKFGNHYGNISSFKGAVLDTVTGNYKIVTTSFIEGIKKEDIPALANSLVLGAYSKGVGTQVGGYMTKKNSSAFQTVELGPIGSDCKSKAYIEIEITNSNKKEFLNRFIIQGTKYVELTDKNIDSFIGKTVKLRSPLTCTDKKICSVCAGTLYYKLGIKFIGLTTVKESTTLTNKSMKKFHDTDLKVVKVDINNIIQ